MNGDAPPTCGAESSEWVFAAVHCSILPELLCGFAEYVYMSEPRPTRTYARGGVGIWCCSFTLPLSAIYPEMQLGSISGILG